jgi:hypothetical protein
MKDEWKVKARDSPRIQKGYFPIAGASSLINLVFFYVVQIYKLTNIIQFNS